MAPVASPHREGAVKHNAPWPQLALRVVLRLGVALIALEAFVRLAMLFLSTFAGISYRPLPALLGIEQRRQIREMIRLQNLWYQQFDPVLGWINAADRKYLHYTQNRAAIRARGEYASRPPAGVLRIAAFGDSFVHGDEVSDDDVWSRRMEVACPSLEVLNFGVSGYGLDQALLRYERDGKAFHPHVVMIGFFPDDLLRNVNVFRPFLAPGTGHQMTKPRFVLTDGQLVAIPNPLTSLDDYRRFLDDPEGTLEASAPFDEFLPQGYRSGVFDVFGSVRFLKLVADQIARAEHPPIYTENWTLSRKSTAYPLTLALFDRFVASVRSEGSFPLIVMLPSGDDIERRRRNVPTSYDPVTADLRAKELVVVDLADEFASADVELAGLFADVHYSAQGNQIFADALRKVIDTVVAPQRGDPGGSGEPRFSVPDTSGRWCRSQAGATGAPLRAMPTAR